MNGVPVELYDARQKFTTFFDHELLQSQFGTVTAQQTTQRSRLFGALQIETIGIQAELNKLKTQEVALNQKIAVTEWKRNPYFPRSLKCLSDKYPAV